MSRSPILRLLPVLVLVMSILALNCEGPQGPPGAGPGSLSDPSIMPEVIYSYPRASSVGPYPDLYQYSCGWEYCMSYSQFQVRFNKFMDVSSVRRAVSFSSPFNDIRADTGFILSFGGDVFVLNPVDSLGYRYNFRFRIGAAYTMSVDSTATDINGNRLVPPFSATFVPEPTFRVMSVSPADGSADVTTNITVSVNFNGKVTNAILPHLSIDPDPSGIWTLGYDSTFVIFSPAANLKTSTRYTLVVDGSAQDVDGNTIPAPFASVFTTVPFRVTASYPSNGSAGVALTSTVSVSFSVPLDTSTIRAAFHLSPATAGELASIYYGTTYISFTPQGGLLASTTYTLRIDDGLRDLQGDTLEGGYECSFTTAPFSVIMTTPPNGATGVSRSNWIYVGTNAPLAFGTVEGAVSISPNAPLVTSACDGCSGFQVLPQLGMEPNTLYTVTVGSSLRTTRGEALPAPYIFSFTTGPD
jgi:hypothetical protein